MVLIQCQIFKIIEYIIKRHKKITSNPSIHIYMKRINNSLVFKIKDEYLLELKTPGTMKLFGSRKK